MIISINNGWINGDWHLFMFDLYHEQPPTEPGGVYGLNIGLLGFVFGIMFHYDK